MWYVYMLRCEDNSLYTGVAKDVEQRFRIHLEGKTGAKYTRSRKPREIVYSHAYANRSDAQKEESRIKQLPKQQKEAML